MPTANIVGQADNLLIDWQHHLWNRTQARGTHHRTSHAEVEGCSFVNRLMILTAFEAEKKFDLEITEWSCWRFLCLRYGSIIRWRSVQGRFSCRQRNQHIPPRALAGKDDRVHFVFGDPGHLPHLLERAFNVACATSGVVR